MADLGSFYYRIGERISARWICVIGCVCILIFLLKFSVFYMLEQHFGYGGLYYICMAATIVILFMAVPFGWLPIKVLGLIKWFARYTPGVFCIHYGIGNLLKLRGKTGTFTQCLVIWIISYTVAFLISKIPLKICKRLVE